MLIYESCRITLRAVLFSDILLLPAAWFGGLKLDGVPLYENRKMAGFEWISNSADNTVLNNIYSQAEPVRRPVHTLHKRRQNEIHLVAGEDFRKNT